MTSSCSSLGENLCGHPNIGQLFFDLVFFFCVKEKYCGVFLLCVWLLRNELLLLTVFVSLPTIKLFDLVEDSRLKSKLIREMLL